MIRRRVYLIFTIIALLSTPPLGSVTRREIAFASDTKECTVYVTRTGARYHRATCSSLRYSRRAMTRTEAVAAGYTPCRRCGGSTCK